MKACHAALTAVVAVLSRSLGVSHPARVWGHEDHEVVALLAHACLKPIACQKANALLAADSFNLASHDAYGQLPEPSHGEASGCPTTILRWQPRMSPNNLLSEQVQPRQQAPESSAMPRVRPILLCSRLWHAFARNWERKQTIHIIS
jgi:hypothetical protein